MMLTNRLTGSVVEPSLSIVASTLPLTPTSRSVVVSFSLPSAASIRTLERIGSVALLLTTC